VRSPHALFGLDGVGQVGMVASLFHGVHQPIPMAGGLQGDLGALRQRGEEVAVNLDLVLDSNGFG
jgi:hypothetical protein